MMMQAAVRTQNDGRHLCLLVSLPSPEGAGGGGVRSLSFTNHDRYSL